MIFVLSGIETKNKGAELMLYAILQEIERKFPESTVYMPLNSVYQGKSYKIETSLSIKYKPLEPYIRKIRKYHLNGILRKFHLPGILDDIHAIKNADYFFDGSGLMFTDAQNNLIKMAYKWEHLLKNQKKQGTKIVFLPQVFGPFEKKGTKLVIESINNYADLIIARENISLQHLTNTPLIDNDKVRLYPDFTSLVHGRFPEKYDNLKNEVCVIPNWRMLKQGKLDYSRYLELIKTLYEEAGSIGKKLYILNHEGKKDERLAVSLQNDLPFDIEVITGLNALDVKGLISSAYMVLSSRFHGLASALNSCVPCLSTSWNYKYSELYKNYELENGVLPTDDLEKCRLLMHKYLSSDYNSEIRQKLGISVPKVKLQVQDMWKEIWNL